MTVKSSSPTGLTDVEKNAATKATIDVKDLIHSRAGIAALLDHEEQMLIALREANSNVAQATVNRTFVKACAEPDADAVRERLLPYVVPSSCRIEVLADMTRVATDCRRNFSLPLSRLLRFCRHFAKFARIRRAPSCARCSPLLKMTCTRNWIAWAAASRRWLASARKSRHGWNWRRAEFTTWAGPGRTCDTQQ